MTPSRCEDGNGRSREGSPSGKWWTLAAGIIALASDVIALAIIRRKDLAAQQRPGQQAHGVSDSHHLSAAARAMRC